MKRNGKLNAALSSIFCTCTPQVMDGNGAAVLQDDGAPCNLIIHLVVLCISQISSNKFLGFRWQANFYTFPYFRLVGSPQSQKIVWNSMKSWHPCAAQLLCYRILVGEHWTPRLQWVLQTSHEDLSQGGLPGYLRPPSLRSTHRKNQWSEMNQWILVSSLATRLSRRILLWIANWHRECVTDREWVSMA